MANISSVLIPTATANSPDPASPAYALPYEGVKAKGCGYYGKNDGLHTVQYSLFGFNGAIVIQGSLEGSPGDDDWFDIDSASISNNTELGLTTNVTRSFKGNFVWVRAVINTFTLGTINNVLFTHN